MFLALGYAPISSSATQSLEAACVPILLSEVEQEQRPSGNGHREAIVVGAVLRDGEGERVHIVYELISGGKLLVWCMLPTYFSETKFSTFIRIFGNDV